MCKIKNINTSSIKGKEEFLMNINKSSKIPIGIITLMLWQVLIILYSVGTLVKYFGAVSFGTGGTMLGISEPNNLKIFLLMVIFINTAVLIGICKKENWSRWIYVVSLTILEILKIIQYMFFKLLGGSKFFFNGYINHFELIVLIIDFIIIFYLLVNRKVKFYFGVSNLI
jgi:hypothetical protein